ncbi:hypothetical protein [Clostridium formicaceticum]|uniref:Uncharacterized protein n=1 Tax=Clostridium formicaceticum TaxID=1497 RepID=A0AAC9WFV4_9CLOT|nr:hypothetical protein [Clostridium formicaceticum]AOY76663.1 hypothetical protein BJL90_12780 [Clostridium formicaceticum]ARE87089.1 hypothetical protein CLFO_14750 [Clostridium formicaceticum]
MFQMWGQANAYARFLLLIFWTSPAWFSVATWIFCKKKAPVTAKQTRALKNTINRILTDQEGFING